MPNGVRELYEFGPFLLDPAERQLRRGEEEISLTPKAFEVLLLLVRHSGRVVSKEDFMREVWPDTAVEEGNLTDNIFTLRQALGDDPREPRYIRTVPRMGYRFVADVRLLHEEESQLHLLTRARARLVVEEGESDAAGPAVTRTPVRRGSWSRITTAVSVLAAIALVAAAASILNRRNAPAEESMRLRSIAVLPFQPLGTDVAERNVGVAMADALITRLTSVSDLVVRPTSAVLMYAGSHTDSLAAAREQRADAVLEGRIQKQNGRLRITVQLVRVADGRTLWGQTFDHEAADIFRVQDTVAAAVIDELSVHVTEEERPRLSRQHTASAPAAELYGAGRYFWSQATADSLQQSVELFQQAIQIDPKFALAHAGLADTYSAIGLWNYKAPREVMPRAREAALAALALDHSLAEARTSLAYITFRYDWDARRAEEEFRRAIAAKRNYAPARVSYAEYLLCLGRFDEAGAELLKARQLDPRSPYIAFWSAVRSYFMRDYRASAEQVRQLLREHPTFFIVQDLLWAVLREAADHDGSVAARLKAFTMTGVPASKVEGLREIYRRGGIEAYRRAEIKFLEEASREQYVSAIFVAMNHAQNGDRDLAFEWLDRAYDERSGWMVELKVDPVWDKIRDDRRFAMLVDRVFQPGER